MSRQHRVFYEFDNFRIDCGERLLLRDGEMVPLTQKAFDLLLALVERQGEVVSKEELMQQVWADSFVEQGSLTQNIYTLRKALGKTADDDEYIATIPRRGYRFAAAVRQTFLVTESANGKASAPPPAAPTDDLASANGLASQASFAEQGITADGNLENQQADFPLTEPTSQAPASPAAAATARATEAAAETAASETAAASPLLPSASPVAQTPAAEPQSRAALLDRRSLLPIGLAAVLLVALFSLGVWWFTKSAPTAALPAAPLTITSLTNTGNLQGAAISPDGRYVAYAVADRQDVHSLWLMQLATYSAQQLIAPLEARYYSVSFSPDGEYVYYIRLDKGAPERSLYRVPLLGGAEKQLIFNVQTAVSFSPDGRQVVFRRGLEDKRAAALIIADCEGGNERVLTEIPYPESFSDPAWSPDGRWIACAAGRGDSGLNMYVALINVSDGKRRQLCSKRWRWIGQMAWLSDARSLLMVASHAPAAPYQVWRLDWQADALQSDEPIIEINEPRRVTNDDNFYNRLSLSADGRSIVATHRQQISSMWLVPRADASRGKPITYGAGGMRGSVAWTPDNRIVFDSRQGSASTISIMDADGSQARLLTGETTGQAVVAHATTSADGRYIVYSSDIGGTRHIWRMNIDGSNPLQLTGGDGEDYPTCTPDNRWVIYTRTGVDGSTLWRVSMDGGAPVQLTESWTTQASVSPDGKQFVCAYTQAGEPSWRIAIFPIDGGAPLKIFPNRLEGATLLQWLPDGKTLSYAENLPGVSKIWLQPLAGGEPQMVTEFINDRIFGFRWSTDGKELACVRGFWATNAVLIRD